MTVDPATLNILTNAFLSAAHEMGTIMLASAYSSIVREAKDTSTSLLDAEGRVVAQAPMIPMHMNSLASAFRYLRENFDVAGIRPGEAFITNNPYELGQHLNDIILFLPVFHDGRLIGFAGSVCHHVDMGGGAPASNADATELYQEGLVIPTMKVEVDRDLRGGIVERMIAANVRSPGRVVGDFHAQIFAVLRGRRLLEALCRKYGADTVAAAMTETQDYSERVMRASIGRIADGVYVGEDVTDGLQPGDPPIPIRARVTVSGDEAVVDLTESADQVRGPINAPLASVYSAVYTFFAQIGSHGVPINDGSYRPIRVVTRRGSICEPVFPAPVRSRMATCYRLLTTLKRAFGAVAPELVAACGDDSTNSVAFGYRHDGGYEVYHEVVGGGNGATCRGDGEDGIAQGLSNTANTPVESLEVEYDFVRVASYGLIPDSGGAGRHRGGLGIRKTFEILKPGVVLSTAGDRHSTPPWGLAGGGDGTLSRYRLMRRGEPVYVHPLDLMETEAGDLLIAETSGGGGFGDPRERPREAVLRDVADGAVSRAAAASLYGVEIP